MGMQPGAYSALAIDELSERISWLIRLRWAAALGVVATVVVASRVIGVGLAELLLYRITAGLAVYNSVLWAINRWRPGRSAQRFPLALFANAQIGIDLVFLTGLLHSSGGIENPFFCYYVFHIVIASILLSRRATYAHAALALCLLSLLAVLEATGQLHHHHLTLIAPDLYRDPVYLLAILFVVGTMLGFSAFMATSITARLRAREQEVVRLSQTLRQHANDLQSSYESLAQLERSKSTYLHRVAHHLRSPLAALERMLAVVAEGRTGALPEKSQEMVERSRERVHDILALARDLLALSRAREVAPRADEQVDLKQVLQGLVADLQPQAAAASVSLESDIDPALTPIAGDPESMVELFENLLSNAVKYTSAGGAVRLVAANAGRQVRVSVSDTGMGIPEEERELIFDEFYRSSNVREANREGTGLGLSIVRAIARAHGGEVSVESQMGVGSTFLVVLPAWRQTQE